MGLGSYDLNYSSCIAESAWLGLSVTWLTVISFHAYLEFGSKKCCAVSGTFQCAPGPGMADPLDIGCSCDIQGMIAFAIDDRLGNGRNHHVAMRRCCPSRVTSYLYDSGGFRALEKPEVRCNGSLDQCTC